MEEKIRLAVFGQKRLSREGGMFTFCNILILMVNCVWDAYVQNA